MAQENPGVVWVIDSMTGHVAVAQRSGYVDKLYRRRTRYFRTAADAIASYSLTGTPDAVLIGYASTDDVNMILREPALQSTPKLFAHRPMLSGHMNEVADWQKCDHVYIATEDMYAHEALEAFANDVVDADEPSWPSENL
jgi:hypothetical protein